MHVSLSHSISPTQSPASQGVKQRVVKAGKQVMHAVGEAWATTKRATRRPVGFTLLSVGGLIVAASIATFIYHFAQPSSQLTIGGLAIPVNETTGAAMGSFALTSMVTGFDLITSANTERAAENQLKELKKLDPQQDKKQLSKLQVKYLNGALFKSKYTKTARLLRLLAVVGGMGMLALFAAQNLGWVSTQGSIHFQKMRLMTGVELSAATLAYGTGLLFVSMSSFHKPTKNEEEFAKLLQEKLFGTDSIEQEEAGQECDVQEKSRTHCLANKAKGLINGQKTWNTVGLAVGALGTMVALFGISGLMAHVSGIKQISLGRMRIAFDPVPLAMLTFGGLSVLYAGYDRISREEEYRKTAALEAKTKALRSTILGRPAPLRSYSWFERGSFKASQALGWVFIAGGIASFTYLGLQVRDFITGASGSFLAGIRLTSTPSAMAFVATCGVATIFNGRNLFIASRMAQRRREWEEANEAEQRTRTQRYLTENGIRLLGLAKDSSAVS